MRSHGMSIADLRGCLEPAKLSTVLISPLPRGIIFRICDLFKYIPIILHDRDLINLSSLCYQLYLIKEWLIFNFVHQSAEACSITILNSHGKNICKIVHNVTILHGGVCIQYFEQRCPGNSILKCFFNLLGQGLDLVYTIHATLHYLLVYHFVIAPVLLQRTHDTR